MSNSTFPLQNISNNNDFTNAICVPTDETGASMQPTPALVDPTTGNITTPGTIITTGAVATGSGAASGQVTCNGRRGVVTFTGVSIAAAATLTLTMANSSITSGSVLGFNMVGATTGSALSVQSVTAGTGTYAWVITNGTGATTNVANLSFTFGMISAT